jgi:hypothetical protein
MIAGNIERVAGRPAGWRVVLAFGIVYLGYGLNFLAITLKSNASPSGLLAVSSDNDHLTISPSVEGRISHYAHVECPHRSNFR